MHHRKNDTQSFLCVNCGMQRNNIQIKNSEWQVQTEQKENMKKLRFVFCNMMPCQQVIRSWHFKGMKYHHLQTSIDPRKILLGLFFKTLGLMTQCHIVIREWNPALPIFKLTLLQPVNCGTICHRINRRTKNIQLLHAGQYHGPHSTILKQVTQKSYLTHSWYLAHCSLLVIQILTHEIMICQGYGKIEFMLTNNFHCKNLKDKIQRIHTIISRKQLSCVSRNTRCEVCLEAGGWHF